MKKILLGVAALFLTLFVANAQDDDFYKVITLNHMYVAQEGYDTLWLSLDKDYNYCYLFVNGSDVDEDQDGDYTDFKFKVNTAALVDTTALADEKLGRDGPLGTAVFDVSAFLKKGDNYIVLGSTEDQGQTDYVVIKDITVACGQDNVLYTLSIEGILTNNGYQKLATYTLDLKPGKHSYVTQYLEGGKEYFIVAFSPNVEGDVDLALYTKKGKKLAEDAKRDFKPAVLQFTPEKSGKYEFKTTLVDNQEGRKARVKLWIYY